MSSSWTQMACTQRCGIVKRNLQMIQGRIEHPEQTWQVLENGLKTNELSES